MMWTIHPGEILREEFLSPLNMTSYRLAKEIGVPLPRIHAIVHEKRSITPDTALRLARFFGTTPEFWMNMQVKFDLKNQESSIEKDLKNIEPLHLSTEN